MESSKRLLQTWIFPERNYDGLQSLFMAGRWCAKEGTLQRLLWGLCSLHWVAMLCFENDEKLRSYKSAEILKTHRDDLKAILKETQPVVWQHTENGKDGEHEAISSEAIEDMARNGSLKKPGTWICRQMEYEMRCKANNSESLICT